ncbi:hypothetical protein P4B35_13605 [Pontiellaceae bacterium B12227]|nr:hypothetical protein [Pontiellaceae bacterium B12227]
MPTNSSYSGAQFQPIEDEIFSRGLNELSRAINISTTYGHQHPAVEAAVVTAYEAIKALFAMQPKVVIGSFNAVMTLDEVPIKTTGTLQKSLERRLTRLNITALKIEQSITRSELLELIDLLSYKDPEQFSSGLSRAGLQHISTSNAEYKAVHDGQTVANNNDLTGAGNLGVLVLDDEPMEDLSGVGTGYDSNDGTDGPDLHIEQIVAFLKGDVEMNDEVGEELSELASDPARLGKIIMESVAVRQSVSDLSGESLGDIILGCLRRTYNSINKQPAFQSSEGKADLRKSLLMLEETLLDRLRDLTGDTDPELDRQIVQAVREMDEQIGFEQSALEYMEHQEGLAQNKQQLQSFIEARGANAAEQLLGDTDFPNAEWRRIVVESGRESSHIEAGLSSLTNVFERLESLMKSDDANGTAVKDLLGQANENLDDTISTTKEKLDVLSQQLNEGEGRTIGGHGRNMTQDELLAALSEVAQELMQPLTAITASLEMMLQGFVGDITADQRDLLDLASNSGEHLKYLMRELINIVGCPTNKGVDSRYHTTSEEVILMQDSEGQEHLPLNFFQ